MSVSIYRIIEPTGRKVFKVALALSSLAATLFFSSAYFFSAPPAHADSEASSEAGLEAPTSLRRRGRRYRNGQQNGSQSLPKAEMQHERAVRREENHENKHLQSLHGSNTTQTYGNTKRADRLLDQKDVQPQGANASGQK